MALYLPRLTVIVYKCSILVWLRYFGSLGVLNLVHVFKRSSASVREPQLNRVPRWPALQRNAGQLFWRWATDATGLERRGARLTSY